MNQKKCKKELIHYMSGDSVNTVCGKWAMADDDVDESEFLKDVTCPKCLVILLKILTENLARNYNIGKGQT
jgi:hypothetical protein